MKITPNQAARILMQDENANWSYNGALALCEYLDEIGYEEMDVVAIRCEFTEYSCPFEAASDYGFECDREEDESDDDYSDRCEEEALDWLRENTCVIEFYGGIIVQEF